MSQLIQPELISITKIEIGAENLNSVNARDIWSYVESKQDFSNWIKKRLDQLGAIENEDYITLDKKIERQILKEYIVSLDIAKHLAMMERNDKGKEVRDYFIAKEKEANSNKLPFNPNDIVSVLDYAKEIALEKQALELKIQEDKPLVDFGRAIAQSSATVKIGDWIKAINESGDLNMGRNKAFKWMRDNKYLTADNKPMQRYVDSGLFELKEGLIVTDTKQIATFTTLLTGKGQMYFAKKLKEVA